MLNLEALTRGYLEVIRFVEEPELSRETNRIVAKIRTAFGRFDETDVERCSTLIRVVMKGERPIDIQRIMKRPSAKRALAAAHDNDIKERRRYWRSQKKNAVQS